MKFRVAAATVAASVLALASLAAATGNGGWMVRHESAERGVQREFDVVARRFAFEPSILQVDEGDRVRLELTTADGTHGFAIKKLGIEKTVKRGEEPVVVQFDAERAGNFEITCSEYCGRGHRDMKGMLVVRPR